MPILYDEERRLFHLRTKNSSYLFSVFDHDYLFSQYWGRGIHTADLTRLWQMYPSGFSPNYEGAPDARYSLDNIPAEYPVYGSGDYRSPAVMVEFENGGRLIDLRYQSHRITRGKTEPAGLPGLDGDTPVLELTLEDRPTGLQAVLCYSVFEEEDVITRSVRICNRTGGTVAVSRALSMSVDLPAAAFDMVGLYGHHINERQIERKPLRHGIQSVESRRGASSHQHNPFIALASPDADEETGEIYGAALVYSGNFVASAEMDPVGYVRLQMGINPFDFRWILEDGEDFIAPEAVMTYSASGFGGMSRSFHQVFRKHLGHAKYRNEPRPIVINNWEATYFAFDEDKLLHLLESCRGLGIDLFVLDDGWFGHRDDDTSSLGDWFLDERKLPRGLTPLIEKCEELGMKFGLWFEPEMISEDSELYAAHPDWCIRQEGRPYCRGRNQLILDLSRQEVLEYLKKAVGDILAANRISYVKWDMNRHMTDAYSAALPPARQPEIYHRYMLNLYALMDYLTSTFPDVLFEGCSGGGGRFDAGMLYYMPQIWTSDDSDAIERLKIQYGTSLVYPPQAMTAHVSACPNHQMGRMTPFKTRGLVAMSASFGYELNPLTLSEEERAQIAEQTALYRSLSRLVTDGDFYRLISPFEGNGCGWMFVLPDRSRAFALYVRRLNDAADCLKRMKLRGLQPDARYHIEELDAEFWGDELMYAGLALPPLLDFEAAAYTLVRMD